MSIKSTVVSVRDIAAFISANSVAYAKASVIFRAMVNQGEAWQFALAGAGVIGKDVKPFAVVWASEESQGTKLAPKPQVFPHVYRGEWVFETGSPEQSRVKYLCALASGAAAKKAAARKAGERKSAKVDPVDAILKAYKALTAAQKRAFIAAI